MLFCFPFSRDVIYISFAWFEHCVILHVYRGQGNEFATIDARSGHAIVEELFLGDIDYRACD